MSQENVEVVENFIAPTRVDYAHLFGDDAVWQAAADSVRQLVASDFGGAFVAWGQRAEFVGLDGIRELFLEWLTPWSSYYDEIERIIPAGDDRVLVLGQQHGRRLDTDAEVVADTAAVYLVRDGKIARLDLYGGRAEALEAVGLSEQDAHADS